MSLAKSLKADFIDLSGIELAAPSSSAVQEDQQRVLTPEALAFVAGLHRRYDRRRRELLARREEVQERLDGGALPDFLATTREIREGSWSIGSVPTDLRDRRVEITGPVDRKMIINALNSGANVFMADFEDSHSPTWKGTIEGQGNLIDAVRRTIRFESDRGKAYELKSKTAVLVVRPRGWHLTEAHLRVDGQPISASLFDFGLYLFHNARELIHRGTGPYFYLPKMESSLEARLWNDVFIEAETQLGLHRGAIKATVLIETILATFEMDEILYELRDHIVGLNCGRWDYIFSYIKKFRLRDFALLPDRALVTMASPFLKTYSELLIHTAHRRGAFAMGGMAAQIPIRQATPEDTKIHQAAMHHVWSDKDREVRLGHDGTWVAHPGLVELAKQAFDAKMKGPNQLQMLRGHYQVEAQRLLEPPRGPITEGGVRKNLRVALIYLESWLRGIGCVPIDHLMEDAATAEIARAQVWQWLRHPHAEIEGHRKLTETDVRSWMDLEEERAIRDTEAARGGQVEHRFGKARLILEDLIYDNRFKDFLTLAAYPEIV